MALSKITGTDVKSEIKSIEKSQDAASRSGRIEILKKVSDIGKEILEAINSKDENLVKIEGKYDDILAEFEKLENEIEEAEEEANNLSNNIEDIDKRIQELDQKAQNGEITEAEIKELEYLKEKKGTLIDDSEDISNKINLLGQQQATSVTNLKNYDEVIDDIVQNMEDFADAGDEIKQSAHDFGRPHMADNLENKSGDGNALKRNESMWGKKVILGAAGTAAGVVAGEWIGFGVGIAAATGNVAEMTATIITASGIGAAAGGVAGATGGTLLGDLTKNKTEKYVEKMGYTGMGDGTDGVNMTYHDNHNGGYHAEYDVIQYGIGGELRDLTAKTWSYGKTINTAGKDMKNRAETLENKCKPEEESENPEGNV